MILHEHPTAELWRANTLSAPYFKNKSNRLKTFDFAVANPPFSTKAWSSGLDPANDEFRRFEYGIPPAKNGDYAFLLHFIASLKSTGKGAIILPHGVLFRGNREADIRHKLVDLGFIKGIIGLPANLFYGTGIAACIVIIDKENATSRKGIFVIDASKGFVKDGNKNRLREQDMHKIVDVFNNQVELRCYARMVPDSEIASPINDYNLNIPRYIDTSGLEDMHNLDAHLNGGVPNSDLDALATYWDVFPSLRTTLFKDNGRYGYSESRVEAFQIKTTILEHAEFKAYTRRVVNTFVSWCEAHEQRLKSLEIDAQPREIIQILSQDLLVRFSNVPLLSRYNIYQRLMDYWMETMQDDAYLIVADGWDAGRVWRITYDRETPDFSMKIGNKILRYVGSLIPSELITTRFFSRNRSEMEQLEAMLAIALQKREEFEEEHTRDEGSLNGLEGKNGISKANVLQRAIDLKEQILEVYPDNTHEHAYAKAIKKTTFGSYNWTSGVKDEEGLFEELDNLHNYLLLIEMESTRKSAYKEAIKNLHEQVLDKYAILTKDEIITLVVEYKWFASLRMAIEDEVERLAQKLAGRLEELNDRYSQPLPKLEQNVEVLSSKVQGHLKEMGLS